MLVDIARLAERFNLRSQNRASKDANLVFYLSVFPLFTLQASDYDVFFVCFLYCFSVVIQNVERHHDVLFKATCREIDHVYQATCSNRVNMRGY